MFGVNNEKNGEITPGQKGGNKQELQYHGRLFKEQEVDGYTFNKTGKYWYNQHRSAYHGSNSWKKSAV